MADIPVLYEDDQVLVINKPQWLVVHADGKTEEPTLVDWLVEKYPSIRGVGEELVLTDGRSVDRSGIVHRLDRETSGAMVVAKTKEAFSFLKRQFQNHEVQKKYHLFVWGELKNDRGIIDRPIGRSPRDFRQWSSGRGARGEMREAITWFRVLGRGRGFSFIEAMPKTGRTHQIRVHFKAVNHPVVSDSLYGQNHERALGFTRTALHSRSIKFAGRGGTEISITAPYPPDFESAIKELNLDALLA